MRVRVRRYLTGVPIEFFDNISCVQVDKKTGGRIVWVGKPEDDSYDVVVTIEKDNKVVRPYPPDIWVVGKNYKNEDDTP